MIDGEVWKNVVSSYGSYRVSNFARIFNVRRGKYQKATACSDGYVRVTLTLRGKQTRSYLVHTIVSNAFLGPRPPGKVCNHVNGKKYDNAVANLEYLTQKENMEHAARLGLLRPFFKKGELNFKARLTDKQVREIRAMRNNGVILREISNHFRIGISTAHRVCTNGWKHIPFDFSEPRQVTSISNGEHQEKIEIVLKA